jgi:Bifunctional DNA primase/polymerase, N-terminal
MFAELASRLRGMGWLAIIPLMPPGRDRNGNPVNTKRPTISGWQVFNRRAPTDPEVSAWARSYPASGIGLAYGPDRVVGIDLDWQDRETATATWDIAQRILGPTPLTRIGAPPKRLALYRGADALRVEGKAFGGFEVFTRSGQTVLYGLHPGTGRAYSWPEECPLTVGPNKLPVVTSEHITALIQGLVPYRPARATLRPLPRSPQPRPPGTVPSTAASDRTTGMAAELMPVLREAPDPVAEAAAILAATPLGNATTRWWAPSSR